MSFFLKLATLLMAFLSVAASAQQVAKFYAGVAADSDIKDVAASLVNNKPASERGTKCWIVAFNPRMGDGTGKLPRTPSLVALKPGIYDITASFEHSLRSGVFRKDFEFSAGSTYKVNCTGSTPRTLKIEVVQA